MYNGVKEGEYTMIAPRCLVSGKDFFLMELMTGTHFSKLEGDRKGPARAIILRELRNICHGRFDADRHGGNVLVEGKVIPHLDFTGMRLDDWKPDDYKQLATVLKEAMLSEKIMSCGIGQFETRRKLKNVSKLVLEAQKAILSLGDYTRLFTSDELKQMLMEVFFSCSESPLVKALTA